MLILDHTGIPGLVCGRYGQPIPVNGALALKFRDLTSVQFACVDCAEKIKKGFPDVRFVLARDYFEALLAPGRPKRLFQPAMRLTKGGAGAVLAGLINVPAERKSNTTNPAVCWHVVPGVFRHKPGHM